jgi:nitroimidazol reductase NimA-like FMN-containing flavoprotein (pyridoxamine 5'-phosphate oxidase superfamily)
MNDAFTPTERARLRRLHERGSYDRAAINAILDVGLVAHVGYTIDGEPYVTPTCYWREGDRLVWHGSSASRMLRTVKGKVPACVTVTMFDGLVLARSGFHCSINYRAVMAFGKAEPIEDEAAKARALEAFVERVAPGRWAEMRPPTMQELKGTTVVAMEIEEASAKVRTGPPKDDAEDYDAVRCWAGVLPFRQVAGTAIDDGRLLPGVELPAWLEGFDLEAVGRAYAGAGL